MRTRTTFEIQEVEGLDGHLYRVSGEVGAEVWREDSGDDGRMETYCESKPFRLVVVPQNGGDPVQYETVCDLPFSEHEQNRIESAAMDAVMEGVGA